MLELLDQEFKITLIAVLLLLLLSRFSRVRSVRPHRRQPTRLPCPWDSPGKSTGVGCHYAQMDKLDNMQEQLGIVRR